MARLLPLLLLAACLVGCSAKVPEEPSYPGPEGPCNPLYTYAPGDLIIHVAADAEVNLNPWAHEFPVFCTPEEARKAIAQGLAEGSLKRGRWRVYQLSGGYGELGRAKAPGKYVLNQPARIVDWVQ